jgi:hypothetical protein
MHRDACWVRVRECESGAGMHVGRCRVRMSGWVNVSGWGAYIGSRCEVRCKGFGPERKPLQLARDGWWREKKNPLHLTFEVREGSLRLAFEARVSGGFGPLTRVRCESGSGGGTAAPRRAINKSRDFVCMSETWPSCRTATTYSICECPTYRY